MNFVKLLRTTFLQNTSRRLLLFIVRLFSLWFLKKKGLWAKDKSYMHIRQKVYSCESNKRVSGSGVPISSMSQKFSYFFEKCSKVLHTAQKWNFSLKISPGSQQLWPNPQEVANLVTFTEEIFNGKLHFFCSFMMTNDIQFNGWPKCISKDLARIFIKSNYRLFLQLLRNISVTIIIVKI